MDILVSTLGATPDIIEETVGLFNYDNNVDFYRGNVAVETMRQGLAHLDEVWLVATDQKHIVKTSGNDILSIQESYCYILQECSKYGVAIRVFVLDGIADIVNENDARTFHDLLLRVVAYASRKKGDGKMYLSLACGRKTMSTDMQDAAYIFGCDNLLHVLGDGKKDATPMLMGSMPKNEAVKTPSVTFVQESFLRCQPSTDYLVAIEQQKNDAQHFYTSYYLGEEESRSNFHILYTLPPSKIAQLKREHIGIDRTKENEELAWLHGLPKSDLHCHLGGALSPEEIVNIAISNQSDVDDFAKANTSYRDYVQGLTEEERGDIDCSVWKENVKSKAERLGVTKYAISLPLILKYKDQESELRKDWYKDYCTESNFCGIGFKKYEQLGDLQGSNYLDYSHGLESTLKLILERCVKENVKYQEVRCSPFNYKNSDTTVDDVVLSICALLDAYNDKVKTSLIFIISRHRGDDTSDYVDLVKQLKGNPIFRKYFRGFDLAGDESIKSPEELRNSFLDIMKDCYNITIHAGEIEDVDSIWQAVYHLNAERIGHGLKLLDNTELLNKFLERGIAIEMCPSSNFQIVGYRDNYYKEETASLREYPLKRYLEKELKVSVNTDDPGISLTDMTHELHKAARMTPEGLSKWDILQLICNGFRSAFYPYEQKKLLIRDVEKQLGDLIKKDLL